MAKRRTPNGLIALSRLRAATTLLVKDSAYRALSPGWSNFQWARSDQRIERLRRATKRYFQALDRVMLTRRFQAKCGEPVDWQTLCGLIDRLQADHDAVLACCAQFPGNLALAPWDGDAALAHLALTADLLRHELREPVR